MSNCINSAINKIFVLTQYNSAALNRHIARTYFGNGVSFGDGFVEVWDYTSGLVLLDMTAELINMSKFAGPPSDLFTKNL